MSNKFTGITSAGSAIPVYDKDAHEALSSKLDITAFSSVSGEFATVDDVVAAVSGKADTSSIPSLDGYATEQWVGEQGYLTEVPAGYATTEDVISATSGLQPSGDYASATDLANYQPVSAMTAFQAAGDYLSANALDSVSGDWNEVSAKLDTTAFSDVSGSFLTSVPDTYLQNADLTIVDNKITEISGVPLSAGDELPSGVMNTSALGYNAVNEISGYNGSAIAQYGAEKQWLVHDDTLVHAANSAQYALGVNLSAVAQLLGIDETVLYEGNLSLPNNNLVLSEPASSFSHVKVYFRNNDGFSDSTDFIPSGGPYVNGPVLNINAQWTNNFTYMKTVTLNTTDTITYSAYAASGQQVILKESNVTQASFNSGGLIVIQKVIGIGRKS